MRSTKFRGQLAWCGELTVADCDVCIGCCIGLGDPVNIGGELVVSCDRSADNCIGPEIGDDNDDEDGRCSFNMLVILLTTVAVSTSELKSRKNLSRRGVRDVLNLSIALFLAFELIFSVLREDFR